MKDASLTRYAWLSILAAIVTIFLKGEAYYLTGSVGLLSDAIESIVNLIAALMALFMLIVAERPADAGHHYGHGKAEYFSSGLEGFLIIVAAICIMISAYDKFLNPEPLQELNLGLVISGLAALVNFCVARVLLKAGKRYASITLEADAKHLLSDVWTSVGVLMGLCVVLLTGWQPFDPIIAFIVGFQIIFSGIGLLKRTVQGLLDATLPKEENDKIAKIFDIYRERGIEFHDFCSRQAGSQRFMTVHVLVPGQMSVQDGHNLLESIEAEIAKAIGQISIITHLEPLDDPASFQHGQFKREIKRLDRANIAAKPGKHRVLWLIFIISSILVFLFIYADAASPLIDHALKLMRFKFSLGSA